MDKALILLSGGQDSCTCLAWASGRFDSIYTIAFDYGQRHKIELDYSLSLSKMAGAISHFEIPISSISFLGGSALLQKETVIDDQHSVDPNLPASFVPGRNYIFLGLAAAKAYQLKISNLVTGVCQTDFSGYPDCRDLSVRAIGLALSLSLDYNIAIYTPLMWKTKAETVLMMQEMGRLDWYSLTHTCYEGKRPPCMVCPACLLRSKGFAEANTEDPLLGGVEL